MKQTEALALLKYYQEWRLGGEGEQPHPKEITNAIDIAIKALETKQEPVFDAGKLYDPWVK